jgi:hypothetical protein
MSAEFEPVISENVVRLREALKRARSLRQSLRTSGVDGIYEHVEDVDGDWLENWTDEDIAVMDEVASNTVVQSAPQH